MGPWDRGKICKSSEVLNKTLCSFAVWISPISCLHQVVSKCPCGSPSNLKSMRPNSSMDRYFDLQALGWNLLSKGNIEVDN